MTTQPRLRFASEPQSEIVTFRLTPTQRRYLAELATEDDITEAEFIRNALDFYVAHQLELKGGSGSSDSGSSSRPSAAKAKVKAASKRSPPKSKGRVQ